MASFLRPLFLRFLLLCVMLNLGDAPYVDELIAETSQTAMVSAPVEDATSTAKATKEQPGHQKTKHSVYEELIALLAMPMQDQPVMCFVEPDPDLRATVLWAPLPAPASSIEKPPRSVAAA